MVFLENHQPDHQRRILRTDAHAQTTGRLRARPRAAVPSIATIVAFKCRWIQIASALLKGAAIPGWFACIWRTRFRRRVEARCRHRKQGRLLACAPERPTARSMPAGWCGAGGC
jgi:hypothetical protein